jgi:hypothetical protein
MWSKIIIQVGEEYPQFFGEWFVWLYLGLFLFGILAFYYYGIKLLIGKKETIGGRLFGLGLLIFITTAILSIFVFNN